MSLNDTPNASRIHIGFFGLRNAGKSSLVNAIAGQDVALVSDVAGTTTDPVQKAMELLPVGPVLLIDTPGIDDEGNLGEARVSRTRKVLRQVDIAVLVVDSTRGASRADVELAELLEKMSIPFAVAYSKADALDGEKLVALVGRLADNEMVVSSNDGSGIHEMKMLIASLANQSESDRRLVSDLIGPGDYVVLVTPIDESAPKGRMILPQQMVMRDILDSNATFACCQPSQLRDLLISSKNPPKLVITDSQVFGIVKDIVDDAIPLTSFSILMARFKGSLEELSSGAMMLASITDDSRILMAEGCTHHRQCKDIGTVKIPNLIRKFTGCNPVFNTCSGNDFPNDLNDYDLIVHCGGCMLNEREMSSRLKDAKAAGVPIVNYGIAIAHMNGILERSLAPIGI